MRRALVPAVAALLACGPIACGSPSSPDGDPSPPEDTVPPLNPTNGVALEVDLGVLHQTITGFGATTLPLVYGGEDYLGALRDDAIQTAYEVVGLSLGHLSTGLFETAAGSVDPFASRGNDNGDPQVVDPAGFDFRGFEALRGGILLRARPYGFVDLTLGPLLQIDRRQQWLGAIRDQDYPRYLAEAAEHVVALVRAWQTRYGEVPSLLTPFNEPTTGNRELGSGSVAEIVDLVWTIGQALVAAGFTETRFVVPNEETPSRNLEVARALLEDPRSRPFVGVIGFHPYPYGSAYASVRRILDASGTGSPDPTAISEMRALAQLGAQYGVPVWMTEVTEGPGNNSFPWNSTEEILARAIHIHDTFEFANASAFFGMNALWDSRSHQEHFAGRGVPFLTEASSIVLVDLPGNAPRIAPMGYAIGHFARWLARGAQRVAVDTSEPRLIASAFRSPSRDLLTLVVVNTTSQDQALDVRVRGGTPGGQVLGESSYADVRWAAIQGGSIQGGGFTQAVPARSVTTISVGLR